MLAACGEAARPALEEIVAGQAASFGVEAKLEFEVGYPPTINDDTKAGFAAQVAAEIAGEAAVDAYAKPSMGAEDFSYVLEKVPGAMFFLGVANEGEDWRSCCAIHSPRMHVDENALPKGTAMLAGCALKFLENGFD